MQRNIHKAAAVILALVAIAAAQIQPFARTPWKPSGSLNCPARSLPEAYFAVQAFRQQRTERGILAD